MPGEVETVTGVRILPLLDVAAGDIITMVGGNVTSIEPLDGGLTNTVNKVVLESGEALVVKHYAGGREAFDTELFTLTMLHGSLPVPDVVHVDERAPAIAYRWIEGVPMNELRRREPAGFATLADPTGRLLAWLARTDATEPYPLAIVLERAYTQLKSTRAQDTVGRELIAELRDLLQSREPQLAWGRVCLAHGDFNGRNIIVQRATRERWRIGAVIDWEASTTFSPFLDLGSHFRYAHRYDAAYRAAFERGYLEAGGELPAGWLVTARLLDATLLIDTLHDSPDHGTVHADCRKLLHRLVADARAER